MNSYRFADLHAGLSHSFRATVTHGMLEQFSRLSGDVNPLHTDTAFALAHGFSERVVHGMLTASFYSTLVGVYLPGRNALLQAVHANFTAPVFPDDILDITGEVVSIHQVLRRIELKAQIRNQHGKRVSHARIWTGINE